MQLQRIGKGEEQPLRTGKRELSLWPQIGFHLMDFWGSLPHFAPQFLSIYVKSDIWNRFPLEIHFLLVKWWFFLWLTNTKGHIKAGTICHQVENWHTEERQHCGPTLRANVTDLGPSGPGNNCKAQESDKTKSETARCFDREFFFKWYH